MNSLERQWPSKKLKEKKRLKSYKSVVKSVLTYNMHTWGLTKHQEEELDRAHRKQLRRVVGNCNIKNKALYKCCKEQKLSIELKKRRWQAFGHILRLEEQAPCQKAMHYYFDAPESSKKFPGHRRITLPICIDNDLR